MYDTHDFRIPFVYQSAVSWSSDVMFWVSAWLLCFGQFVWLFWSHFSLCFRPSAGVWQRQGWPTFSKVQWGSPATHSSTHHPFPTSQFRLDSSARNSVLFDGVSTLKFFWFFLNLFLFFSSFVRYFSNSLTWIGVNILMWDWWWSPKPDRRPFTPARWTGVLCLTRYGVCHVGRRHAEQAHSSGPKGACREGRNELL